MLRIPFARCYILQLKTLYEHIAEDWKLIGDSEEITILRSYAERGRRLTIIYSCKAIFFSDKHILGSLVNAQHRVIFLTAIDFSVMSSPNKMDFVYWPFIMCACGYIYVCTRVNACVCVVCVRKMLQSCK